MNAVLQKPLPDEVQQRRLERKKNRLLINEAEDKGKSKAAIFRNDEAM